MIEQEGDSKATFSFGGPVPPISSFFFPYESPDEQEKNKERDEQDNSPQSP